MNEILFLVDEAIEGGYNARAQSESIFTQANTLEELNVNIADALECHFDEIPNFELRFVGGVSS